MNPPEGIRSHPTHQQSTMEDTQLVCKSSVYSNGIIQSRHSSRTNATFGENEKATRQLGGLLFKGE